MHAGATINIGSDSFQSDSSLFKEVWDGDGNIGYVQVREVRQDQDGIGIGNCPDLLRPEDAEGQLIELHCQGK
jgi:hypothetical protein